MQYNQWFLNWPWLLGLLVGGGVLLAWLMVSWRAKSRLRAGGVAHSGTSGWGLAGADDSDPEADELMGASRPDPGVLMLGTDDYGFADRSFQLGALADLQQDVRELCRLLAEQDGSKEEFFPLFERIRLRYPGLPSRLLPELNVFIREQVPFLLSEEELEGLWS